MDIKEFNKRKDSNTELNHNQTFDAFSGQVITKFAEGVYKFKIIRGCTLIVKYFKGLDVMKQKVKDDSRYRIIYGDLYLFDVN